jgi:hypothetical protein
MWCKRRYYYLWVPIYPTGWRIREILIPIDEYGYEWWARLKVTVWIWDGFTRTHTLRAIPSLNHVSGNGFQAWGLTGHKWPCFVGLRGRGWTGVCTFNLFGYPQYITGLISLFFQNQVLYIFLVRNCRPGQYGPPGDGRDILLHSVWSIYNDCKIKYKRNK